MCNITIIPSWHSSSCISIQLLFLIPTWIRISWDLETLWFTRRITCMKYIHIVRTISYLILSLCMDMEEHLSPMLECLNIWNMNLTFMHLILLEMDYLLGVIGTTPWRGNKLVHILSMLLNNGERIQEFRSLFLQDIVLEDI